MLCFDDCSFGRIITTDIVLSYVSLFWIHSLILYRHRIFKTTEITESYLNDLFAKWLRNGKYKGICISLTVNYFKTLLEDSTKLLQKTWSRMWETTKTALNWAKSQSLITIKIGYSPDPKTNSKFVFRSYKFFTNSNNNKSKLPGKFVFLFRCCYYAVTPGRSQNVEMAFTIIWCGGTTIGP